MLRLGYVFVLMPDLSMSSTSRMPDCKSGPNYSRPTDSFKLDIIDLNHSFGITALQTAVGSSGLLAVLLGLTETCMRVRKGNAYAHGCQGDQSERIKATFFTSFQDRNIGTTESILLRCFQKLRNLIFDIPRTWARMQSEDECQSQYKMLHSLANKAYGLSMDSAVYWMFFRIGALSS